MALKELTEMSDFQKHKLKGLRTEGEFLKEIEPPTWYDEKKFLQGKLFFKNNMFCVFLSHLFAVLLVMSVPRILRPLIQSKKSDQPFKALKRYVNTIRIVMRWYEGDLWDPEDLAHKSIKYTTQAHSHTSKRFNYDGVKDVVHLPPDAKGGECYCKPVREDLVQYNRGENPVSDMVYVNQWDLSIVQYSFVGLIAGHQEKFGLNDISNQDMEGFVHFWRVIGYLMGITDEFNVCKENLEETRNKMKQIETEEILSYISRIDTDFEYMGNALMDGMSHAVPIINFPTILYYLIDVLGGKTHNLYQRFNLRERFLCTSMRVVIYFLQFDFVKRFMSAYFLRRLDLVEGSTGHYFSRFFAPKITIAPSMFSNNYRRVGERNTIS